MNNYLNQLDINNYPLNIFMKLQAVSDNGSPNISVVVNKKKYFSGILSEIEVCCNIPLLSPIEIEIALDNKIYSLEKETGIIIKNLTIDNTEMIPKFSNCIEYTNDQNQNVQAFYLGFNGIWRFKINEPFYQWLHKNTGQGWLLEPAPLF